MDVLGEVLLRDRLHPQPLQLHQRGSLHGELTISARLRRRLFNFQSMGDRLANDGYLTAGYESIHIDDCWLTYERDRNGRLVANQTRFPSGIPALADYVSSTAFNL